MFGGRSGDGGGPAPSVLPQRSLLQVNPADVPALELKLGALVVLLCITLLFGFAPFWLVRGAGLCCAGPDVRLRMLSLISCFAGGVFLATCLLDLLPDFLQSISAAFSAAGITFPLPEFIVASGFLLVLVLEQMVLAFAERPSSPSEQHQSLLADASIQKAGQCPRRGVSGDPEGGPLHVDAGTQSALRAFLLLFSLSPHSVFEGLAVGLLEDGREVLQICLALSIQQSIIAFSLAFTLWQGRLRRSVVATCLLTFAAMSPLGIGVGMGLAQSRMSPQHQLAHSALEGLATGTFIYITFMQLLPQELHSAANRIPKVATMLAGFAVATAVLFIKL